MMRAFADKLRLVFFALFAMAVVWVGHAEAIDIYLCSTNSPCTSSTNPVGTVTGGTLGSVNISGWSDGVITISDVSSSDTAKVEVDDRTGTDRLTLKGAKLTIGSVQTAYVFDVVALNYSVGPDLAGGPNYHVQGINQTFKRGALAASGDVITVRTFVRLNSANPWTTGWSQQIGAVPSTADPYLQKIIYSSSSFFGTSMLDEAITDLNQARDLKMQLTIEADKANDYLSFPSVSPASPLEVKNTTSPGGGDLSECSLCPGIPPPPCTKSSMLSSTCATTWSTMKAFGCPTCVTDDRASGRAEQIRLFVDSNWDSLQEDMARGGGEHLISLATMLQVPDGQQQLFCALAKETFRAQSENGTLTPQQLIAELLQLNKPGPNL